MSLMSWFIWSSSLATGSGVAGTLARAVAEAESGAAVALEPEGEAAPDAAVEADGDALALSVTGGGVDGTAVALCFPQPATASATSSSVAATVAGRTGWRIKFEALLVADPLADLIIDGPWTLANGPV
jgi:hypothetical protein